jgi:crotonobetainyl-CoA:carnitine CoA-transferase CaiB-like acyl-CoA transferase
VYCSITGFGQTGPYRARAGYDYAIQGMGGLMSVTGERDDLGGGPQKVGVAVADLFTGMYATVAILAALRHAERTGEGQHIDMALLDTQVAMLANLGANYLVSGTVRRAAPATRTRTSCPTRCSRSPPAADGSKDHLILAVGNDSQFAKFCAVAGRPELAAIHASPATRTACAPRRAGAAAGSVMKSRTKADWLAALEAAKVPCGAINNLAEVFADPQVQQRGMVHDLGASAQRTAFGWWPARSSWAPRPCAPTCRRRCWASTPTRCCRAAGLAAPQSLEPSPGMVRSSDGQFRSRSWRLAWRVVLARRNAALILPAIAPMRSRSPAWASGRT